MSVFHYRLILLLSACLLGNTLVAQTNPFNSVLSLDSLAGFNEQNVRQEATAKGLFGMEYSAFVHQQKRQFVNNKYSLPFVNYEEAYVANYKMNSTSINVAPCVNEDFEANSFAGWSIGQGTNGAVVSGTVMTACVNNPCSTPLTTGTLASIVSTPFSDLTLGLTIPNSPFGGTKVAKLNTSTILSPFQFPVVKIAQQIPVTLTNSLYDFAYYAVMDASSPHLCCEQPYMYVKMRDCFGNLLSSCPVFSITLPGTSCPGTGPTSWVIGTSIARSNGWQRYSIDLAQYIGCTITVEVTVGHCQYGGHWGYAYFDSRCNTMNFSVNSNTISAPSPAAVSATVACATTATLTAPTGLGPYQWVGPLGSGITSTNQAIVTNIAGQYSISMAPVGICNPINRRINLSFPPPTTLNISPSSSICTTGSVTSATLSASGAAGYTWSPPGFPTSFIVVSPSVTSIYTLTGVTGTCAGTWTQQITVNPTPTVNILSSNTSLCPGQVATLTALGANSFSWLPSGPNTQTRTVSQASATTYSVIGTETTGCSNTATMNISMSIAPSLTITPFTSTFICSGGNVTAVAGGASNFTWNPGGATGFFQSLTAFATTDFTVIGSSGTCSNSAILSVSVDPGPTLNITPSPTIICPGNSMTLTALGAAALGYTWNPGAIISNSTVITPTAASVYSVNAINAKGCVSTTTLIPNLSPVPIMTISPASPSICAGSSLTLTASGGSTYTWSPVSIVANSIAISPTSTSVYNIVGSNGTCTSSINSTLVVVPLPTVGIASSATAICVGQSVTLTANGAGSYTWLPSLQNATTIVVSPTVTTVYTLTGKTSTCNDVKTITITVNNLPVLGATASPTAICPGFVSTLTGTGAATYTWNPGGLSGASPTVSPASTTIYTVTGASAFGCVSTRTVSLVVNPTPTVNASVSVPSICVGATAALTASGAVSYSWNPGALTGSNVSVSPASTTVYTVSGANALGCITQKTVSLIVVPVPTLAVVVSPTAICLGASAVLSATGALNYTWNPGALIGSTANVSPTTTTTYSIVGNSSGCISNGTVQLIVNTGPNISASASPTAICPGFVTTLNASGAATYTWNPGNISTASFTASPASSTNYTLIASTLFGCTTTSIVSVVVNTVPGILPSTSTPTLCVGSSASLSATGALTYTWNPGSLTGSLVSVSPAASTVYSVAGTNTFGCVGTNSINLTVVPIPTISSLSTPTAICAGASAVLTASGAVNYTWNPGASTSSSAIVSPTITTTYTVTGNSAGCSANSTVQLIVNNGPSISASASPTAICPGFVSTISASGATSYTWNPGGLTAASFTDSPASSTVYSLTAASAFGCITTTVVNLTVHPTPTISPSVSSPSICAGSSASLSATGAATYTWNPGALTGSLVSVSPAASTVYSVTGASSVGCLSSNTINLNVVPNPTVNASVSPTAVCVGFTATLSATGANNYTWTPGAFTSSSALVSPTVTTTYTVSGNTAGCASTNTVQLVVNNGPTLAVAASPTAVCPGFSSILSSSGAASYTWNPGNIASSLITVTPTPGNVYTLTGATALGCLSTATVSVLVYPTPTIIPSAASGSICVGSSENLSATGAATYTWDPGFVIGSPISVSPLVTTVYSVTGTSSTGCISSATINVTVVPNPTVTAVVSPTAICVGSSATLSSTGATNYTWSPVGFTGGTITVSPSSTTTYTVFGNDAGCTSTRTVQLIVNTGPSISAVASPTGICPGFVSTISATGAASYTWNPGAISSSNFTTSPSSSTAYSLSAASAFGCITNTVVNLVVYPTPTIVPSASSPSICVNSSASLSATGAASYTWSPGALTGSLVSVTPSSSTIYSVTGASSVGCLASNTINLNVVPNPTVSSVVSPTAVCQGLSATLTGTGATTYTWNPGALTGSSAVVAPSTTTTYTLIGNTAGCTATSAVQLIINPLPSLTLTANSASICSGSSSTVSASGATSYTWSPGSTVSSSLVVNPLSTSNYTATGISAAGCTNTAQITLTVSTTPTVVASVSNLTICLGASTTLTFTGAANYLTSPGAISGSLITLSPVANTTYTVVGTTGACSSNTTIAITVNPLPTLTVASTPTNLCTGNTASLSATGAVTYTWLPINIATANATVNPLTTTIYTVNGTSSLSCVGSKTLSLLVSPTPSMIASASSTVMCIGSAVTLSATGAVNYTWQPGASTASSTVVSPTSTTTYTLFGNNGSICSQSITITVSVNPLPTLTVSSTASAICVGTSASLSATGAQNYTWTSLGTGSAVVAAPLISTTYTVTGQNSNGCVNTETYNLVVNNNPTLTANASPTVICNGGSSNLTVTGAQTYSWSPIAQTGSQVAVSPISNSNYTVTGTDLNGCVASTTLSLQVLPNPSFTVALATTSICAGQSNTLTATGATNYTWLPGGTTGSTLAVTPSVSTIYTIVATNTSVCSTSVTSTVNVNPLPNYTAAPSSTISCATPSITLNISTSNSNLVYLWSGPNGFTSAVQSPTGINTPGTYSVIVSNTLTGCISSASVAAVYDNSIPSLSINITPSITCAVPTPSLNASHTTTNPGYAWTGPNSYTSSAANPTVSTPGVYTLVLTDLSSGCTDTGTLAVGIHTLVTSSSSLSLPTCSAGLSNNNGTIRLINFSLSDRWALVAGSSFTGSTTYSNAVSIASTGIVTNTLANPSNTVAYTLRIFDVQGCFRDSTFIITPTDCEFRTLGIAKAVSSPAINSDGSYNVTYTVTVKNYDVTDLREVQLTENLASTFASPASFTLQAAPQTISGSGLSLNANFNGGTITDLLIASESTLAAGSTQSFSFEVRVKTPLFERTYNNTVLGVAKNGVNAVVVDSSNVGFDTEPVKDVPTPVVFVPLVRMGLTKEATYAEVGNGQFDITYTITAYNIGNDTLKEVSIRDSLAATVKLPAQYSMLVPPSTTGGLVANSNFGVSDLNLVNPLTSRLDPNSSAKVVFTIRVTPDTVTVYSNSAYGSAKRYSATTPTISLTTSDISNSGSDPDSDDNLICNESNDNLATIVVLPVQLDLFIPQGFSPDNDGINDQFVIQGLPRNGKSSITIFNRWGNKVYTNEDYSDSNAWDGSSNVNGTLGQGKLPQGTYYYVLELVGTQTKTLTGFIILQY